MNKRKQKKGPKSSETEASSKTKNENCNILKMVTTKYSRVDSGLFGKCPIFCSYFDEECNVYRVFLRERSILSTVKWKLKNELSKLKITF